MRSNQPSAKLQARLAIADVGSDFRPAFVQAPGHVGPRFDGDVIAHLLVRKIFILEMFAQAGADFQSP